MSDTSEEFKAIQTVHDALQPLNGEARTRVLTYIASLFGIDERLPTGRATSARKDADEQPEEEDGDEVTKPAEFGSFAELYAKANPKSNGEKALVAGYWLQECGQAESFTGAGANKELTHLGHKVANITDAINSMKNQKPMLILQIKKSGVSRQARKLYKVSHEGMKRVEELVGG